MNATHAERMAWERDAMAEAFEVSRGGSLVAKLRLAAHDVLASIFADPMERVHYLNRLLLLAGGRDASVFFEQFQAADGAGLLEQRPTIDGATLAACAELPPDTLGGAWARHMVANDLRVEYHVPPPFPDPEMAWFFLWLSQTHDVLHALLGLDTRHSSETVVFAFYLGQIELRGCRVVPLLAPLLLLAPMVHSPGVLLRQLPAWRVARAAPYLLAHPWHEEWETPLVELRERLGVSDLGGY